MNEYSPLLKANQNRCKSCGGLLNVGGGHFNLTDCGKKTVTQSRRDTLNWHLFPTGWEADSPKDFFIEGA